MGHTCRSALPCALFCACVLSGLTCLCMASGHDDHDDHGHDEHDDVGNTLFTYVTVSDLTNGTHMNLTSVREELAHEIFKQIVTQGCGDEHREMWLQHEADVEVVCVGHADDGDCEHIAEDESHDEDHDDESHHSDHDDESHHSDHSDHDEDHDDESHHSDHDDESHHSEDHDDESHHSDHDDESHHSEDHDDESHHSDHSDELTCADFVNTSSTSRRRLFEDDHDHDEEDHDEDEIGDHAGLPGLQIGLKISHVTQEHLKQIKGVLSSTAFWVRVFNDEHVEEALDLANNTSNRQVYKGRTVVAEHEDDHSDHDDEAKADQSSASGDAWLAGLGASVLLSLITLFGLAVPALRLSVEKMTLELIGLAVGSFLGAIVFMLLPETVEMLGFDEVVGAVLLGGIMFGYIIENVIHVHHDRTKDEQQPTTTPSNQNLTSAVPQPIQVGDVVVDQAKQLDVDSDKGLAAHEDCECCDEFTNDLETGKTSKSTSGVVIPGLGLVWALTASPPVVRMNLLGEILHSFVDGALIGAAAAEDVSTMIVIAASVWLHEIPMEIADFGFLIHFGMSHKQALFTNFMAQLSGFIGCVFALALNGEGGLGCDIRYVLPFAAGVFAYQALANLVPELTERLKEPLNQKRRLRVGAMVLIGIGLMALLLLLPHEHGSDCESAGPVDHSEHDH